MRDMAPCGSFSELHSVARRPTFCGGVSGAKLSRSAISSRMALLPRLMVSLTVWWLWLLVALEDVCTSQMRSDDETLQTPQSSSAHDVEDARYTETPK